MDKVSFIRSTVPRMADFTFPYLASILGVVDSTSGEHVGSGLRCVFQGRRGVATALHVAQKAAAYPGGFALSAGYGNPPYVVHAPITIDHAGDLAFCPVPDDYPIEGQEGIRFWPENRIQWSAEPFDRDFLFAHGFPAAGSRFLFGGVASQSLPYGVMQRLEGLPADLDSFQFAVDFDPTQMHGLARPGDVGLDPRGMSGSPVWRIGIQGRSASEWTPEHSIVIGFLTQWRPAEKVLVGTIAVRLAELRASHDNEANGQPVLTPTQ